MEIHGAANITTMTVADKAVAGSSVSLGKPSAPATAEMRSAFEAMVGSLLGLLGGGQKLALPDVQPAANPAPVRPAAPGLENAGEDGGRPSLDSPFARPSAKMGWVVATLTSQTLAGTAVVDGVVTDNSQTFDPAILLAGAAGQQPIAPTLTILTAKQSDAPVSPNGMPTTQETGQAIPLPAAGLPLPLPDTSTPRMENGVAFSRPLLPTGNNGSPIPPQTLPGNGTSAPLSYAPLSYTGGQASTPFTGATPIEQISGQVTAALAQGSQEIAVALQPTELGAVRIQVQRSGGELQLSLGTEEPATNLLIANALGDLRQKLEVQGVKVGELTVTQTAHPPTADSGPVKVNRQQTIPVASLVSTSAQPTNNTTTTSIEQISGQVIAALVRGEQTIAVTLQPKELGTVHVEVQRKGGELQLSFRAEEPATGHLLTNVLGELRQKLEVQGFKIGEFAVAQSQRSHMANPEPVNSSRQQAIPVTVSAPAPARPTSGQKIATTPTEQISGQVMSALLRGEQETTIALQPEELGKLYVELQRVEPQGRGEELLLSLRAEEPATGRLLINVSGDLRQKLEAQGVKVGELVIAVSERPHTANTGSVNGNRQQVPPVTVPASMPVQPANEQKIVATPVEQVSKEVMAALGLGEQESAVVLQPKELGTVRVQAQRKGAELQFSLWAEEPATGHLLTELPGDLRQKLEVQGVKVGELVLHQPARQTPTETNGQQAATVPQAAGSVDVGSQQMAASAGTTSAPVFSINSTASASSIAGTQTGMVSETPAEQIGEHVQIALGRGDQETTIALHPKELGSVRIRMQMENGQLHLSIRAEEQSTGRLLTSRLADLRQSLESQGIKVGELAVSRGERPLPVETLGREVAPAVRSGQMDMNPNDAHSSRQQAGFPSGNFGGGTYAGGQNGQHQESGVSGHGPRAADVRPAVDPRHKKPTTSGPAGVDYYA